MVTQDEAGLVVAGPLAVEVVEVALAEEMEGVVGREMVVAETDLTGGKRFLLTRQSEKKITRVCATEIFLRPFFTKEFY